VRWDDLFGDLEAQLAAADAADLAADADQRLRLEVGRTTIVGRLRAAVGQDVALGVADQVMRGRIEGVGPDWLLLGGAAETLLPLTAVGWLQGLGRASEVSDPGRVWSRLGLRSALRGLARDRAEVRLHHASGLPVVGTIDRVGDDHLDLALHPPGEPRRAGAVTAVRTVSLASIRAVVRGTVV
jgi:hypothetical protein